MRNCRNIDIPVENLRLVMDKEKTRVEGDATGHDKEVDKTEVDQLESTRAEMTQVKEENERLKTYLNQITRDCQSLQMRFLEASKHKPNKPLSAAKIDGRPKFEGADDIISLSLGMASSSTDTKKEDKKGLVLEKKFDDEEGLALGLDCKFEVSQSGTVESEPNPSPDNSFEEEAKADAGETRSPSKVLKTMWCGGDDEVSQQNPVKRARVSVRARCDSPTMNDGCRWRKYGQKIAKGNPCPRAYYRCTVVSSCPVKKQVQRCAEDMSILITTYEGTHNHTLPMSATGMASTTSAAAHMLLSGSSSSSSQPDNVTSDLQAGINCLFDASGPRPFYTPNTLSTYATTSCPTITLDLTSNPPSSSSSILSRFSSKFPSTMTRYPTGSLNFGNIPSIDSSNTRPLSSWGGNDSLVNSFGPQLFNKNNIPTDSQKTIPNLPQSGLPDSISAATKAIAADPSFQSALASALKSIIGGNFGDSAEHFRS